MSAPNIQPPVEGEKIFVPDPANPEKLRFTWVDEMVIYTQNHCYKVRDKHGKERLVKRHPAGDQAGKRAWISL